MSLLITIEGLDGTGKSTLAAALTESMALDPSFTQWIYQTKEPGLTTVLNKISFNRSGMDIRSAVLNDKSLTPLERELMFYVDASQHRRFIENQQEAIIVSDRGLWSHFAYLRATLKTGQMDYRSYAVCRDVIELTCPLPDRVIYLKGDLQLMEERNRGKAKDVIESNGLEYFGHVLETYEDLAFENEKCLVLNASNSTSQNVELVIKFLKEAFTNEQLRSGHL